MTAWFASETLLRIIIYFLYPCKQPSEKPVCILFALWPFFFFVADPASFFYDTKLNKIFLLHMTQGNK
jgi:hypothetical protein